jgi:hypothetical protein
MRQAHYIQLLYRTSWLGCILGFAATVYFLAGLYSQVNNSLLNGVTILAILLVALFVIGTLARSLYGSGKVEVMLGFLIVVLLLVEIVLGFLPPTGRDELTHHLLFPRLYVQAGRIFDLPFAPYSYFPMLLDMLYTPWLWWGSDSIPKLVHGLFGILTALLIYAYLAHRLSVVYGLLGFFIYLSTPAILKLANLAYVDLGLVFYSTAALLCLLCWLEEDHRQRWLVLAGISAGFAVATKPNGLLVLLVLSLLLALALGKHRRRAPWILSRLLFFGGLSLVAFSPWAIKNWTQTGNPLFPFYTDLLGGTFAGEGDSSDLSIFEKRRLLYGENWLQIAALPLRIFFSGRDNQPQFFDGVLTPMLLLFLPWAFSGQWAREKKFLLAFAGFYFAYALFLSDLRIRYLLPIVPPLAVLSVYGIHNIHLRNARPYLLYGAFILLTIFNGVYLWNYFQSLSPLGYLSRAETRAGYLARTLPDYRAFDYINRNLPDSARIYLLFMARRAYYCEREYFHDLGESPATLLRVIHDAKSTAEIQVGLGRRGITHLIAREGLLQTFLRNNLLAANANLWDDFVRTHLTKLYQDGQYAVFQIDG